MSDFFRRWLFSLRAKWWNWQARRSGGYLYQFYPAKELPLDVVLKLSEFDDEGSPTEPQ